MNLISKTIQVKRRNVPYSLKAFMHTDVQECVKGGNCVFFETNFVGFVNNSLYAYWKNAK